MKKISFHTLGCRLNQAETGILKQTFEQKGFEIHSFSDFPETIVIHTCTVTEKGDQDTRKLLNKIAKKNPLARVAVIGCQAERQKEALLAFQNVHWVVGSEEKMNLAEIIDEGFLLDERQVRISSISKSSFTLPAPAMDPDHTRIHMKIQDGCDFFCTFCVIPFARGRSRSRNFEDLLQEGKAILTKDYKEMVLTGINLGDYRDQEKTFFDVLTALLSLDGDFRMRISSIELTTLPTEFSSLMKENPKLCSYAHIPLQSGSDAILEKMKRRYTGEDFKKTLEAFKNKIPRVCLGTDVMVGFPGETSAHFEETLHVLESSPLAYFHVFSYSDRPGTRSTTFSDKVPGKEIRLRSKHLRNLSSQKRKTYQDGFLGQVERVLFEQEKEGFWVGLTDTYIRVRVRSSKNLKNTFCSVRLEKNDEQIMDGVLV